MNSLESYSFVPSAQGTQAETTPPSITMNAVGNAPEDVEELPSTTTLTIGVPPPPPSPPPRPYSPSSSNELTPPRAAADDEMLLDGDGSSQASAEEGEEVLASEGGTDEVLASSPAKRGSFSPSPASVVAAEEVSKAAEFVELVENGRKLAVNSELAEKLGRQRKQFVQETQTRQSASGEDTDPGDAPLNTTNHDESALEAAVQVESNDEGSEDEE